MKYFKLLIALAVFVAGAMALNNTATTVDAHNAVDKLADRYNVCYTCPLPNAIAGGDEINAITRAGVRNIANMTPKELHNAIDVNAR